MKIEFFGVDDRARMAQALAIRFTVFVNEQHVPPEIEIDEHDRDDLHAVHALALAANGDALAGRAAAASGDPLVGDARPVGTARFYERDARTVQIGRMAVVRGARRRGVGRALLEALLDHARERGYTQAALHAQTHASGFYAAAGFTPHGETFLDAGIPHVEMMRAL